MLLDRVERLDHGRRGRLAGAAPEQHESAAEGEHGHDSGRSDDPHPLAHVVSIGSPEPRLDWFGSIGTKRKGAVSRALSQSC
jgi:hypothetical protein